MDRARFRMILSQIQFYMVLVTFLILCIVPEIHLDKPKVPPLLIVNKNVSANIIVTTTIQPTIEQKMDLPNKIQAEVENELDSMKFKTALNTRYLQVAGSVATLLATSAAIYIYSVFSGLQNHRTYIHKNLFTSILLGMIIRLILYSDQLIVTDKHQLEKRLSRGIENVPYLCESLYTLLEYTDLVSYFWMFLEGYFIYCSTSAKALRSPFPSFRYCLFGWVGPAIIIAVWVVATSRSYTGDAVKLCWFGYQYLPQYYIVLAPKFIILGINSLFTVCVIRVVYKKTNRTRSDLDKVTKAVRAGLILSPLLGLSNIFGMFEYPLDGSAIGFAIWCYSTEFLKSFQGVLIAVIYCFTNREVINEFKKCYRRNFPSTTEHQRRRRSIPSLFPESPIYHLSSERVSHIIPMTTLRTSRCSLMTMSHTHDVTVEPPPRLRRESIRPRSSSLPIRVSIPGFEQLSPVRIPPRSTLTLSRGFVRPGLVTRESRRARASSCFV